MDFRRSKGHALADPVALAARRTLRELAAGPLGALIVASFRVVPQQQRSMETVERMLAAAERLIRRSRSLDRHSLEAIAAEAHVTPQAAYRYFRDSGDVTALFVRRIKTVEHERLMLALLAPSAGTAAELGETAVSFVAEACGRVMGLPARVRDRLLRDHGEIAYELVWALSDRVCAARAAQRGAGAAIGPVALCAGLVAVMAVALSFCLCGERRLDEATRAMMLDIFHAAAGAAGEGR